MPSVSDAMTLDGKLFQMRGAAMKNARHQLTAALHDLQLQLLPSLPSPLAQ